MERDAGVQGRDVMCGLKWEVTESLGREVTGRIWTEKEGLRWEVVVKCEDAEVMERGGWALWGAVMRSEGSQRPGRTEMGGGRYRVRKERRPENLGAEAMK